MFNNTFYPTPEWLTRKLIDPLKLHGAYVLEPSAGKGDILDVIHKHFNDHYYPTKLYAIEIEPELRSILESKGYPVVGDDFLAYEPRIHFNYIVMNPPFASAEEHIMHAWHILYEGEIAAIINATSLEGKTAQEKVLLQMIEDYGSVEHVGQAFKNGAERATDAEIAIVRLKKTASGSKLECEVENDRDDPVFDDGKGSEIALTGFIDNLLASFNAAMGHYAEYNRLRQEILRYTGPFAHYYRDKQSINVMETADNKANPKERYNTFVELLQEAAWHKILGHPGFQAMLTERARAMMSEFRARQRRVDFNEANIRHMLEALMLKKDEILEGAILDAFDTMTEYHKENRVHVEGWKSDLAWKVNHKVVLPYYVRNDYFGFSVNYSYTTSLDDIDRAMCVIAQRPYNDIVTIVHALESCFRVDKYKPGVTQSTFFKIRYFKKGTIHLTFKDLDLLKEFNYRAAKGRGWLGPGTHSARSA